MHCLNPVPGQLVIVTGSSRGIGRAIASAFLSAGASVVLSGLDPKEFEETHHLVQGRWGRDQVCFVAGNVAHEAYAAELVNEAILAYGRLDSVVCNAGIDIIKNAVDYTPTEWDRVLSVNLRGAFLPAQAAARHWIAAGSPGSVTMTSSIAGSMGVPTLAPCAASKGGVDQLVRTLAAEWAPHGIRVNAVAPGYMDNIMDAVTAHDDPASDARITTFTPLGRRASITEIAAPYALLASRAAGYITGAVLPVDGGYTVTWNSARVQRRVPGRGSPSATGREVSVESSGTAPSARSTVVQRDAHGLRTEAKALMTLITTGRLPPVENDSEAILHKVVTDVFPANIQASFSTVPKDPRTCQVLLRSSDGSRSARLRSSGYLFRLYIPELDVIALELDEDLDAAEEEAYVHSLAMIARVYLLGGGHMERRRGLFRSHSVLVIEVDAHRWELGRRFCRGPIPVLEH